MLTGCEMSDGMKLACSETLIALALVGEKGCTIVDGTMGPLIIRLGDNSEKRRRTSEGSVAEGFVFHEISGGVEKQP